MNYDHGANAGAQVVENNITTMEQVIALYPNTPHRVLGCALTRASHGSVTPREIGLNFPENVRRFARTNLVTLAPATIYNRVRRAAGRIR